MILNKNAFSSNTCTVAWDQEFIPGQILVVFNVYKILYIPNLHMIK